MQEHDCAVRLTFFLDMDDRWHLKVHGLIDQGEFRVPLNHTVRAAPRRGGSESQSTALALASCTLCLGRFGVCV